MDNNKLSGLKHPLKTLQGWSSLVQLSFFAVTAVSTTVLAIRALDIGWRVGALMAVGLYLSVLAYFAGKMVGAREGYAEAKIKQCTHQEDGESEP